MGGNGGSSGSTGGTGDIPDAGPLPDAGDATAPLVGRPAFAAAICARLDEVADPCDAPLSTCADDLQAEWAGIQEGVPGCTEEIDAYFGCIADEPIGSFRCDNENIPRIDEATNDCQAEQTALQAGFGDNFNCGEPL